MLAGAPKGTKDTLPERVYKWRFVEEKFAEACRLFGFSEIRTPTFEHTELFARGVGDSSDIVEKQMYSFTDYGNRSMTLRPEGTAGVVRAFIENKLYAEAQPTKLWYEIPCFRYEKPQSGRLREFHQFGIELFGSTDMAADTEVIALADFFLRGLGITALSLRINSIGCPVCRESYRGILKSYLEPKREALCDTCQSRFERNPMRILDCKSPVCRELVMDAPYMLDFLCDECGAAFNSLKRNLTAAGIEFVVDPGIVRGLDYYTKTAFEFVSDQIGAQGTVCGGGRYDHLIESLGGPAVPGVGFGLGIERLLMVLEAGGVEIAPPNGIDVMIVTIGDAAKNYAFGLLRELRAEGLSALMDDSGRNIKNQLKYADRIGAAYALIIGDDELKEKKATLRNMRDGTQREAAFSELAGIISTGAADADDVQDKAKE